MRKEYWDNFSFIYDIFISLYLSHIYNLLHKKILGNIKDFDLVLEVATGTGITVNRIGGHIYAIDISNAMLRKAKSKCKSDNVKFINMDAEYLGFKSNTFDKIICLNGIHVFRDPILALQEMKRVLKTDGLIMTATFCYGDIRSMWFKLFLIFSGWLYMAGGMPPYLHQFDSVSLLNLFRKVDLEVLCLETIWHCPLLVYICARKAK